MSDTETAANATTITPVAFNEREVKLMSAAFQCLKSSPECDYDRMAKLLDMSNPRSAANALAALRKKMVAIVPANDEEASVPATPKKTATPRKRGRKPANASAVDEENGETTPKPKSAGRKRGPKPKEDGDVDVDATASPKKKARATPKKKSEQFVKEEPDSLDEDETAERKDIKMEEDAEDASTTKEGSDIEQLI